MDSRCWAKSAAASRLPVLLMTAFGDVDKAVAAMRGGACDFMLKPFEPKTLLKQIARYARAAAAGRRRGCRRSEDARNAAVGRARGATDATVLLTGESGVGKEVFARYIHDQSARAGGPFVAINCAAIPDNLLEATLFGYEKGAFTGAQTAQAGKFEQANGGTLLLDEISEMPLGLQAKLLRVLQEREVERVGGKKPVAARHPRAGHQQPRHGRRSTGRTLPRGPVLPAQRLSAGDSRLRERPGDILPLARHCLARQAVAARRTARFAAAAEARLMGYAWPGNVRELENVVHRALIMTGGESIEADSLPLAGAVAALAIPVVAVSAAVPCAAPSAPTLAESHASTGASANMKDLERQHILDTLAKVGGSRKKAVAMLGISERTLRYKLSQYREEGFFNDDEEA
jgi:two-component system response regulator FlrC